MNLTRPLVSLDLEATGTDPATSRVVEVGIVNGTGGAAAAGALFSAFLCAGSTSPPLPLCFSRL